MSLIRRPASFVGERRKELGVRMALGANSGDVAKVVLHRTLGLCVAGVALGLLGAWWLARYLGTLLDEVAMFDAGGTAVAIGAVSLAVFAGAAGPLRRALSVDPVQAMRD
jgi:putative ABC transport system permease protein